MRSPFESARTGREATICSGRGESSCSPEEETRIGMGGLSNPVAHKRSKLRDRFGTALQENRFLHIVCYPLRGMSHTPDEKAWEAIEKRR